MAVHASGSMPHSKFTPAQAEELAAAFNREGVDYLRLEQFKTEYLRRNER